MFNPSRLTIARRRRGLSKKLLAKSANISDRTISALEAAEYEPPEDTVRLLADNLEFPLSFFYQEDLEEFPTAEVSFRALSSMTAGQRDAALGAGALAFALNSYLDSKFSLPQPDLPDYGGESPEAAAVGLRAEWGLGDRYIKNVIHLLESKGVRVYSLVEECHEVDAFSLWKNGSPLIFLNTKKSAERSRFDAAHELGHLVLHRSGQPSGRNAEIEANAFASAFLMPQSSIMANPILPTLDNLLVAKRNWGVSVAALTFRLASLKIISEWHYRTLFKEISTRGWRTSEPNPMPKESSLLLNKVFSLLKEDGISKSDIAQYLHITPLELDKMVFGLVITSMPGGRNDSKESRPSNPRPDWRVL